MYSNPMLYSHQPSDINSDLPHEPFTSRLRHRRKRLYIGPLPAPLGTASTYDFEVCGLRIYNDTCLSRWPEKWFTGYQCWWLEVSDELFRKICPADLLDLPCPFRGSRTRLDACKHLRVCNIYQKWNLRIGECAGTTCPHLHGIEPTCRSLQKQIAGSEIEVSNQFRAYQACKFVAGTDSQLGDDCCCDWGHDFEGARIEAIWNYFNHLYQAQRAGYHHFDEQRDAFGHKIWKPKIPDIRTLSRLEMHSDGISITGLTFHGHRITIPIELHKIYVQRAEIRICEGSLSVHLHDMGLDGSGKMEEAIEDDESDAAAFQQGRSLYERRMSAPTWLRFAETTEKLAAANIDTTRSRSIA